MQNFIQNALRRWCWKSLLCEQHVKQEDKLFEKICQIDQVLVIYRTITLSVVLYGCETWSLTLREERKLRVFGNMVLRRIFVPRGEEETGKCLRLHIEEPNDLNCSPIIVRVMKSRKMR